MPAAASARAPARRLTASAPTTGAAAPPATVSADRSFALPRRLIPVATSARATPAPVTAAPACSFARLPRLTATAPVPAAACPTAAGLQFAPAPYLTPVPAAVFGGRFLALSLRLDPPAADAGTARLFAFAHRRRPSRGRLTGRGPPSSTASARAALLCR